MIETAIPHVAPHSASRTFSHRDLSQFGERFALDYRYPDNASPTDILSGQVEEFSFRPGMQLVRSDVEVLETYESRSLNPAPLCLVVVLEGQVGLSLGSQTLELSDRTVATLHMEQEARLDARQRRGQRLKVLTLSVDAASLTALEVAAGHQTRGQVWQLPDYLAQALAAPQSSPLWLEGLSLQLLSLGLQGAEETTAGSPVSPRDRRRLADLRDRLAAEPQHDYTMTALAGLAAMSPSSLRSKFKAVYGQTVFEFLKARRLELARGYLEQGYSVQQAAHFTGYRHATNLTAAFRRRYGLPPSQLVRR
ncbi:helix-turn-helix transcriptional regulator [Marinobacter sp. CA1]|uniref:helix-turn-helix transcriptional regulator n=1 Tax=Marinobacter sp. CA1 TaxID=2817656 RepID=UPI001D07CB6E|nr:helix-turn-helix transcriptional regulator [Marinobacter sp. CA1]UDL06249.1 helix-turn-helix transcriptional regulator [Marinobacter sp. CA1]